MHVAVYVVIFVGLNKKIIFNYGWTLKVLFIHQLM